MAFGGSTDSEYDCEDEDFQSFKVDKATGFLDYLGASTPIFFNYGTLTFAANNQYAYQATCSDYCAIYEGVIDIYKRQPNGLLERSSVVSQIPDAKSSDYYCADEVWRIRQATSP